MSYISTLMENEEVKSFLDGNTEKIEEASVVIDNFPNVLKSFVLNHPQEFIAEDIEETRKNIRVFTEVATAHFITEVTSMFSQKCNVVEENIQESAQNTEKEIDKYI